MYVVWSHQFLSSSSFKMMSTSSSLSLSREPLKSVLLDPAPRSTRESLEVVRNARHDVVIEQTAANNVSLEMCIAPGPPDDRKY